jgi:hypothetical protein
MSALRGFVANKFAMRSLSFFSYPGLYASRFGFAKAFAA